MIHNSSPWPFVVAVALLFILPRVVLYFLNSTRPPEGGNDK